MHSDNLMTKTQCSIKLAYLVKYKPPNASTKYDDKEDVRQSSTHKQQELDESDQIHSYASGTFRPAPCLHEAVHHR